MAIQSTSLTFSATNQQLYYDTSTRRIDTGDSMVASVNIDEFTLFDFDIFVLEASLSVYLNASFGIRAWVELGTTGTWDAEYQIDVDVGLPNAVIMPAYAPGTPLDQRAGAMMKFDFTDFDIVKGEVSTVGFNTDPDVDQDPAAVSGIDLIIDFSAGIRKFFIDGPIPWIGVPFTSWGTDIDEFSRSNISFFDEHHVLTLFEQGAGDEEFRPNIPGIKDYFEFFLRTPTGANTEGSAKGTGAVTARGTSETRFTGIEGDVDAMLLKLASMIPEPNTQAIVKGLEKTVFWEGNLLNWASIDGGLSIPDSLANISLTVVDLTAGLGLSVSEDFTVDITDPETGLPNINISLLADNGSVANGKLGDILYLESPNSNYGTTNITATYTVDSATATHQASIDLDAYFNVKILEGEVSVFGKKLAGFDALYDEDIIKSSGTQLGGTWEEKFSIDGSVFGVQTDVYSVFYVEDRLAPSGWDPENASFENDLYAYFEESYQQVQALLDKYDQSGFSLVHPSTQFDQLVVDLTGQATPALYAWSAGFDAQVKLNHGDGSRVLVGPSPVSNGTPVISPTLVSGYFNGVVSKFELFSNVWSYSSLDVKYQALTRIKDVDTIRYTNAGKYIETENVIDFIGNDHGDTIVYFYQQGKDDQGGSFFDGGGNLGSSHDVFIADLSFFTDGIFWDLAKSVDEENDLLASTKGGVTLTNVNPNGADSSIVVRNVEAVYLKTGSGDDYLVGSVRSDAFLTGDGDDIVRLKNWVENTASTSALTGATDTSDDYVRLGKGRDTVIVEMGNVALPTVRFTDYIFGGEGVDYLYVQSGEQGLRWDMFGDFFSGTPDYYFGGNGIGADAAQTHIAQYLDLVNIDYFANFGVLDDNNLFAQYAPEHYLLLNGGPNQGRIEVAKDIEHINVITDANGVDGKGGGTGGGDDLVFYVNGSTYDGGAGIDTFAADFSFFATYDSTPTSVNIRLNSLDPTLPAPVSYYGATTIENFERLHVRGSDTADLISGGALDDYIDGGDGNDFLYGGFDTAADTLKGGNGDDAFLWQGNGDDRIEGGNGFDTLYVGAFATPVNGGEENYDPSAFSGISYKLYNTVGDVIALSPSLQLSTTPYARDLVIDFMDKLKLAASVGITDGGRSTVNFSGIEAVNVIGSDRNSDILVYQGGSTYIGGESLTGRDQDTFVADFRDQDTGIEFQIIDDTAPGESDGYWLANGIYLEGIEQARILGGSGFDLMSGGKLSDFFVGGGGNDVLIGNGGNDFLDGGQGSDQMIWDSFGYDYIVGGTDVGNYYQNGRLVQVTDENDNLILTGGTYDSKIIIKDANGVVLVNSKNGAVWADSNRDVLQQLAENSQTAVIWQYYNSQPGNLSNRDDASLTHVTYTEIESVDIAGTDDFNEIVVFQNGTAYTGGESVGDGDLFVGDFRAFSQKLTFNGNSNSGEGYDIGQGTKIADFERFHLLLGDGNDVVLGGDQDDTVYAGGGRDHLVGGAGNDHFFGEAGNDIFEHTYGNDVFDGGAGTGDTVTISGRTDAMTVAVFDAGDTQLFPDLSMITGTPSLSDFASFYAATTAAYIVVTHGANSLKYSNIEETLMSGSEANDVLVGGSSQGVMFGGGGNDALLSGAGNDFISGGAGSDVYVFDADFGKDIIFGETTGNSKIVFTAYAQSDLTFSLDGIDLIIGKGINTVRVLGYFAKNDTVGLNFTFETTDGTFTKDFTGLGATAAGARPVGRVFLGDDTSEIVTDGTGKADVFRGFGGDDAYYFSGGGDLFDGGAGTDSVSFYSAGKSLKLDLEGFTALVTGEKEDLLVSIENVYGTELADEMLGNQFDNLLSGYRGDDTISGRAGNDLLIGLRGNDTIDGGADNDQLFGGIGKDTLIGGSGDDFLSGDNGNDILQGGAGRDLLSGGLGNDALDGGADDDVLVYSGGLDTFEGGTGSDSADFSNAIAAVTVDLRDTGAVNMALPEGGSQKIAQLSGIENVLGSIFDDKLIGTAGVNQLEGATGDDVLIGGAGADILSGGAGLDFVDYGSETGTLGVTVDLQRFGREFAVDTFGDRDILSGIEGAIGTDMNDVLYGGDDGQILFGGGGDDKIFGKSGNDLLYGGAGDDDLRGGINDDILTGGAGDDWVFGDKGDDLIIGGEGGGTDFYYGGTDDDRKDWDGLSYATTTQGIVVDMLQHNVTGVEVGNDKYRDIEYIIGGLGDDTINGSSNTDHYLYVGGFDTYKAAGGRDMVSFELVDFAVRVDVSRTDGAQTADGTTMPTGTGLRTLMSLESVNRVIGSDYDDHLIGSTLDNRFFGGKGNDLLDGGATATPGYDDQLFGGDGNDTLVGAIGVDASFESNNVYDGGAGTDVIDFSDHATGVTFNMKTGDGNDTVTQVEILRGSAFNDVLTGDDGSNILIGGKGSDSVWGLLGDDLFVYVDGFEAIYGGGDSDTLDFSGYGFGVDVNLASSGATAMTGRASSWTLGTPEVIVIAPLLDIENAIGSANDDRLQGNELANLLSGGAGNDRLQGLGGDDIFTYTSGFDIWAGDDGIDTANFSKLGTGVLVDMSGAAGYAKNLGATSSEIVNMFNMEDIVGTLYDDRLIGGDGANKIEGLTGDDTLFGGKGADTLSGSDGDDILDGGAGADKLLGGLGADTASYGTATRGVTANLETGLGTGGEANGDTFVGIEHLSGSEFGDTLTGDAQSNTLTGLGGKDTLNGGAGDDVLIGGGGADVLNGGTGIDLASYVDATAGVNIDLSTGLGAGNVARGDTLTDIEGVFGSSFNDKLTGNDLANILIGSAGNDTLIGGLGSDMLDGGAGADKLLGGEGNDQLIGGDGNDLLDGGLGANLMVGGAGNDTYILDKNSAIDTFDTLIELVDEGVDTVRSSITYLLVDNLENLVLKGGNLDGTGNDLANRLTGTNGNNTLVGLDGKDTLKGKSGDDNLDGGLGDDVLSGDKGDDILAGGDGNDILNGGSGADKLDGGRGNDKLVGGGNGDRLLGGAGNDNLSGGTGKDHLDGGRGNDKLVGDGGNDILIGGTGNDRLLGGAGKDTLSGGIGKDTLDGGGASDTLSGGGGNDRLLGGDGNDTLTGGAGLDKLTGGGGNDTLTGNSGADVFIFSGNFGKDKITDFKVGTDTLRFESGNGEVTSFAQFKAAATQVGTDLRYDLGADNKNVILLLDTDIGDLKSADINFA